MEERGDAKSDVAEHRLKEHCFAEIIIASLAWLGYGKYLDIDLKSV